MKKINVSVFGDGCDCTNSGVTSSHKRLVLYSSQEAFDADEDRSATMPALILGVKRVGPEPYVYCYPEKSHLHRPTGGVMAGGNFVYTSDSRFSEMTGLRYPISVHDRQE